MADVHDVQPCRVPTWSLSALLRLHAVTGFGKGQLVLNVPPCHAPRHSAAASLTCACSDCPREDSSGTLWTPFGDHPLNSERYRQSRLAWPKDSSGTLTVEELADQRTGNTPHPRLHRFETSAMCADKGRHCCAMSLIYREWHPVWSDTSPPSQMKAWDDSMEFRQVMISLEVRPLYRGCSHAKPGSVFVNGQGTSQATSTDHGQVRQSLPAYARLSSLPMLSLLRSCSASPSVAGRKLAHEMARHMLLQATHAFRAWDSAEPSCNSEHLSVQMDRVSCVLL